MVWSKQKRKKENIMSVSCKSSIEVFCSASHAHNGGISHESWKFYAHLSEMISEKRKENYAFLEKKNLRKKIIFFVHV